jgi:hypothetical protein
MAGVQFSDLFADFSYILSVPSLTTAGWIFLLPPPVLNLLGVVIMLWGYYQRAKACREVRRIVSAPFQRNN